jgi:hypothetical protein
VSASVRARMTTSVLFLWNLGGSPKSKKYLQNSGQCRPLNASFVILSEVRSASRHFAAREFTAAGNRTAHPCRCWRRRATQAPSDARVGEDLLPGLGRNPPQVVNCAGGG